MSDLLCEEHVRRLELLDKLANQLASNDAAQSVRFDQFCLRFDERFTDLKTDLQGIHTTLRDHNSLLVPLNEAKARHDARSKRLQGVGWAALTAGVIGGLAKFGAVLLALLRS
jgi:hypothetical protein